MNRRLMGVLGAVAALLLLAGCQHLSVTAPDDPLPSWQGPAKAAILEYVDAVSTPGGQDFIPPAERIAAFDLDGTLMCEKPWAFVVDVSVARLRQICPEWGKQGPEYEAMCEAARKGDKHYLYGHIDDTIAMPFMGMPVEQYAEYARRVFHDGENTTVKRPHYLAVYQPQLELLALLRRRGFTLLICSGSSNFVLKAISEERFGVPRQNCVGTFYHLEPRWSGGVMTFQRGKVLPPANLGPAKAVNLMQLLGRPPVLACGNSSGDVWMLRMAQGGPRRSLCMLLDHDDPREVVYSKKTPREEAVKSGWLIISMKDSFKKVFPDR